MTKLVSTKPQAFLKLLTESVEDDEAIQLQFLGLRGLAAETTENLEKPQATVREDVVPKSALVTFVAMIVAFRQGRPVKLIPTPKTWKVCFGPTLNEQKNSG